VTTTEGKHVESASAAAARAQPGITSKPTETNATLPPAAPKSPSLSRLSRATKPHDHFTSGKIPANAIDRGKVV